MYTNKVKYVLCDTSKNFVYDLWIQYKISELNYTIYGI